MGQKVNPTGLRIGVIKDWNSRWFVKDSEFGDTIASDYKLRAYLKKTLYAAGIAKIEIERDASRVRIHIHCAKPGLVIGKGGTEIDKLRATCEKMLGKTTLINIVEVRNPDLNAQLVAENIAQQLEKRISFRRAMKQAIGRAMKMNAKGIKSRFPAVWAARKLRVPNSTTRVPFRCRRCVRISTMALLRRAPLTAGSV